jgi:phosphomannomutase
LHYGRDALAGIALFLSHLAISGKTCSQLRAEYPSYFISKNKIEFKPDQDIDKLLDLIAGHYEKSAVNREDGLKIDFEEGWVHLRKSNTEPIVRIYAEGPDEQMARDLAQKFLELARKKQ